MTKPHHRIALAPTAGVPLAIRAAVVLTNIVAGFPVGKSVTRRAWHVTLPALLSGVASTFHHACWGDLFCVANRHDLRALDHFLANYLVIVTLTHSFRAGRREGKATLTASTSAAALLAAILFPTGVNRVTDALSMLFAAGISAWFFIQRKGVRQMQTDPDPHKALSAAMAGTGGSFYAIGAAISFISGPAPAMFEMVTHAFWHMLVYGSAGVAVDENED